MDILLNIAQATWTTLADMAPYLLFGFLAAGILSVVVPPDRVERHLGGRGIGPIFKASLFGVPLPLCSCSVIPVAASLRKHGASKPATVAFLTSTPQTGVDSILVTYSLLGPVFAVVRPVAALLSGIVAGLSVRLFGPRETAADVPPPCEDECCAEAGPAGASRLRRVFRYGFVSLPRDLGWPLVAGLAAAGVIAALVPPDFVPTWLGNRFLAMVLMMLVGIPLYVCATASVPIAAALIAKGVSPGAALVFLMTGPATNAATVSTLVKIVGWRNTILYLLSIAASALAAGWVLDAAGSIAGPAAALPHLHESTTLLETVSAVLLLAILAPALIPRRRKTPAAAAEPAPGETATVFRVRGMTCEHCEETVRRAALGCRGVRDAEASREAGRLVVRGTGYEPDDVVRAVQAAGYEAGTAREDPPAKAG